MKHVYTSIFTLALLAISSNSFAQGPNGSGTYYAAADGKKGAELKTALCGIIRPGLEENVVSYTPGLWNAYPTTDARPDDNTKVWDMYSSISNFTFVTNQDKGGGGSEGDFYNREHSFPRSWFGGAVAPMNTDLFHVYPTDKVVNGKRSNYPYGETNGANYDNVKGYTSSGGFSKLGASTLSGYQGAVFEPNDIYKGDFARSYFYMVTCYEEQLPSWYDNAEAKPTINGTKYPAFTDWQLEMLMRWSKNDPVDNPVVKETPRNEAVYGIQKNRNPFIDYPGLEEYIWGEYKDVAFSYDNYNPTPTIINVIREDERVHDNVIYNLSGQVVDKSYKGIVIINGKKVIQK